MRYYFLASLCFFNSVHAIKEKGDHSALKSQHCSSPAQTAPLNLDLLGNDEFQSKVHHEDIGKAFDLIFNPIEVSPNEIGEEKKKLLFDIFKKDFPKNTTEIVNQILISLFPNNPNKFCDKEFFHFPMENPLSPEEINDLSSLVLLNDDDFGHLLGDLGKDQKSIFSFLDEVYEEEYLKDLELDKSLEATVEKFLSDKGDVSSYLDELNLFFNQGESPRSDSLIVRGNAVGECTLQSPPEILNSTLSGLEFLDVKSRRRSLLKGLLSQKKHTIGSILEHLKKEMRECNINLSTIIADMIYLRIKGEVSYPRRTKEEIEERRNRVRELRNQGEKPIDIFRTLKEAGLCESDISIRRDLKILESKGLVVGYLKSLEPRTKRVRELWKKGLGPKAISGALGCTLRTVEGILSRLKKKGGISDADKIIFKRRSNVASYHLKGNFSKEISGSLSIERYSVHNDLRGLRKQGLVSKAKNQTEIAAKKRKDIKKLSDQGKSPKNISACSGIPLSTVEKHLAALRKEKLISPTKDRKKLTDRRRELIKKICEKDRKLKLKEIAEILKNEHKINASLSIVSSDLNYLKQNGLSFNSREKSTEEILNIKRLVRAYQGKSCKEIIMILKRDHKISITKSAFRRYQ